MKELDLLVLFKNLLVGNDGINEKNIKIAEKNKSKIMDFNFIEPITNRYISLEAKTFNDTRSNSNYFLSLFGKIIKGRKLNNDNDDCKNRKIEYGFLFDKSNEDKIKKYFSIIYKDDWLKFCEVYELTLIYICEEKKYYVYNPKSFIEEFVQGTSSDEYFNDDDIIESEETEDSALEMEGKNHEK